LPLALPLIATLRTLIQEQLESTWADRNQAIVGVSPDSWLDVQANESTNKNLTDSESGRFATALESAGFISPRHASDGRAV